MKRVFSLWAVFAAVTLLGALSAAGQDKYLMPAFGKGMVYFRGQPPATGMLNIYAEDHSLRFLDKDGKELSAINPDNIIKVTIDTVSFLRCQDLFYRLFPIKADVGVALLKTVSTQRNAKQGAFGTTSQTAAVKETSSFYADGVQYNLDGASDRPYTISEALYIYKGDQVYPLGKRGLRKVFPDAKEQIDAYFRQGGTVPDSVPGALELLERFVNVE